ncbi:MAG: transcription-repair coupling factor [Bacteroidia bacterium]|nr:transcription-repair coupling factor [Bacteroidia bacterium]
MKLQEILKLYQDHPEIEQFAAQMKASEGGKFRIRGMAGSQPAFVLAALYRHSHKNTLVILNDKEEALYFLNDLQNLMPRKEIQFFPASYKRPYQIEEIDNANVLQRAEVLNQLNHTSTGRQVIITFAEALCEKVINKRSLVKSTLELKVGENVGMDFVVDLLEEYGFEHNDFVYEPGQFSVRGGICDVYSFAHELPYRIEFFGPEVESIRTFDPVTQLSEKEEGQVSLIPNIQRNLLTEEKVHFLEYISSSTQVFVENVDFVKADLDSHFKKAENHYAELQTRTRGAALSSDPMTLYTDGKTFSQLLDGFTTAEMGSRQYFRQVEAELQWTGGGQPNFKKEFELLDSHLRENMAAGVKNFIFCEDDKQIQRLEEIFAEIDNGVEFKGLKSEIHKGFLDKKLKIACYTDHEIFQRYHRYKSRSHITRSQALTLKELKDLAPGDFVTHVHHGIGRFAGLHKIKVGENDQEAIKIIYLGGDEIYVNVNSLYKVSKFTGKEGTEPKLSKLGSKDWAKKKSKVKARLKELAFDLIQLYATRKSTKGFAFAPDTYMQRELEASFMYIDTPDQEKCTDEVKRDLESTTPMDRLVCGDVGFGKTEIAVRAAFKAVADNKQVAILVPTTILAVQHYHTFKERLEDFPAEVDYINRFKSSKEIKETLEKVKAGKIDILIGTHRIVSQDVRFKDLGLLIIDEEQKFGVGVKDKLKLFKSHVDTLTLTATPIPRTLQFSLLGIRDLSVLGTPPPNRQPVETVVSTLEPEVIRDAISYELKRGGQCFFVHNRVADLEEISAMIRKLVPDSRIAIAHGQLAGTQVEAIMKGFIENQYDVLVCTTIIESGLDIPNANTIIINQAQNFGLSDLHQMRGRVGRSNRKAFCYLLAPHDTLLSKDAQKRLKAIEEFSDLGSGFHIALRDLDIRGAGDLFGPDQSGFISEIGYEVYHQILDEAIMELKEEHFGELFHDEIKKRKAQYVSDTQVETDLNILIPESYIPGVSERLTFYKRIAGAESENELRAISREMLDRFGPIPDQVLGLLDSVRIRDLGKQVGFEKVVLNGDALRIYFVADKTSKYYSTSMFARILGYATSFPGKARFKESPKYLSLVIQGVAGIKDVYFRIKDIYDYVLETAENKEEQPK